MKQTRPPDQATSAPGPPVDAAVIDTATLELLKAWRLHDATDSPEEIRAAEDELAEFKRAMNQTRTSAGQPLLFP